ncbi:PREDICTED: uncharacterized protein LOC109230189 [Nicotiana attenuata]|uniref:uncharacterized protein LOC109230189 n=1 Tax=Nicotiana attenuata TaxID=49451 RepID=UPI0009051CC0|nr:PREDICTED: uncharacterized protein LOC109230189 [Nicotiana attenuata]
MDRIPGAPPVLKVPDFKKYTQLSYKSCVAPELIPKRFKMLEVPKYDGTSDPQEHITTYTTTVKGNDLAPHEIEYVLLKKIGETLTRGALTWYSLLPEHSIDSFEMLADCFINAHAGARKKERILLPAVLDEWTTEAFTKGLNPTSSDASQKLKESLLEFEATTWADAHNWYESKIRIKDDQTKSRGRGFRIAYKFTINRRTDRGRNNRSLQDKETSGSRDPSYPKLSEYNFNVSVVELVSAMRNIKEARFRRPMRFDPSKRDPNLWCKYHGMNGHQTSDCRHLRKELKTLLNNGNLREFLSDRAKNNYGRNRDNAEPSKAGEEPPR